MPELPLIELALFCDSESFVPALVSVQSLSETLNEGRQCRCHLFFSGLKKEQEKHLEKITFPRVCLSLHPMKAGNAGQVKQSLAELLPDTEKLIWAEAGSLFICDAGELYAYNLHDAPFAAARAFSDAKNSGKSTMLLDLSLLRKQPKLWNKQSAANLPVRYSLDASLLWGGGIQWNIKRFNRRFGTRYSNEKELFADAAVICFSGTAKPWLNDCAPCVSLWRKACLAAPLGPFCPISLPVAHKESCMVSVVMPCYNVAPYLSQTLDCIFSQSYQDFELICCDDESTDETLSILRSYAENHPNMKVLSGIKKDAGFQRNRGTDEAQGKYIYYMDSDDLLDEGALETLVSEAERLDLDLVYFEGDSFFESKSLNSRFAKYATMYRRTHLYPGVYDGRDFYAQAKMRDEFPTQPCMKLTRHSLLTENHIRFSEVHQMNDVLHSMKTVMASRRCAVLPCSFYHRRVHDHSLVTNKQYKNADYMIESRSAAWVGLCKLLAENRDHPKACKALSELVVYLKSELDWALEETNAVPDFRFMNSEYSAEDVMGAAAEWFRMNSQKINPVKKKMSRIKEDLKSSRFYPLLHRIRNKIYRR